VRTVLVVGAGLAGVRCAETLRSEGYDGRIVLVGEERHAPYRRPALSKELLAGEREDIALRPPFHWHEQEIELVLGARVERVTAGKAHAAGRRWAFDRLVLATGARPRRIAAPDGAPVHVLRTLDDALALRDALRARRRLVLVGSGFVGGEVATTAAKLGVDVTVVEAASSPLGGLLGEEVGSVLAAAYRRHGIELRLDASVERIERQAVVLGDGTRLSYDLALVGIGAEPARELERPAVLLAGDVTGSGHWTAASQQGADAARRLLGLPVELPQAPYVWSDQLGYRLQLVGDARGAALVELEGDETAFVARYLDGCGHVRGGLAANRPDETGGLRRALGTLASVA
jgi:3-phenylpropionate/trans-cinnamate dioxygenase ferredoxin reductase subunit